VATGHGEPEHGRRRAEVQADAVEVDADVPPERGQVDACRCGGALALGGALKGDGALKGSAEEHADAGNDHDDAAERRARRRVDLSQGRGHRRPVMTTVNASDPRRPAQPATGQRSPGAV
jgi:hypothetical protein